MASEGRVFMRYHLQPTDAVAAAELGRAVGVSATLGQVLLNRGIRSPGAARDYFTPTLAGLLQPDSMADRASACSRIVKAIDSQERIVIFGDYDVDGTTSAAILAEGLRQLGATVTTFVANRFKGGYGFSEAALERVMASEPSLVVTCDCGSSDHARLATLRNAGIDALVVDHHLVPDEPLPVTAFLNPHRPDCGFPFKGMCSAGLAFSLLAAIRREVDKPLDMKQFLDLVALGTIADVAPLSGDNRRLVRAGLALLSSRDARPGIRALRRAVRIREGTQLGAIDVAFRLTPRLNAPGRLGDQSLTLALLLAKTDTEADSLAQRVECLNEERRTIERAVTEAALAQVEELYGPSPSAGIVIAQEGFHPGVVGISAARLVDRFGVPAVVVALDQPYGHGSARGPAGFPLFDGISRCSDSLVRFGGHQAACGVAVRAEEIAGFREQFAAATADLARNLDAPTKPLELTLGEGGFAIPSAQELGMLEPLGEGNPEPLFWIPRAVVVDVREIGQGHLKMKIRVGTQTVSAFGFEFANDGLPSLGDIVKIVGQVRPDHFRGGHTVEVRIAEMWVATQEVPIDDVNMDRGH